MSRGVERVSSEYAAQGSVAHMVAEAMLRHGEEMRGEIEFEGFQIKADDEMAENTKVYTKHCFDLQAQASHFAIEEQVFLDGLWDGAPPPAQMYGTADFIAVIDKTLHVVDLKYGAGVAVEAYNNTQLMYYAVGALLSLPEMISKDIDWVEAAIVQPRAYHADGPIRYLRMHRGDLMLWAKMELRPAVERITSGVLTFATGKWCRFCPVKATCPALAQVAPDTTKVSLFKMSRNQTPREAHSMADDDIGMVLDASSVIKDWLEAVKEEAERRIAAGAEIPGWSLGPKRAVRQWADEVEAMKVARFDLDDATFAKLLKLITVAQAEKLLIKKHSEVWTRMVPFSKKESSGMTLVRDGGPKEID
jgi:hypothetical protein